MAIALAATITLVGQSVYVPQRVFATARKQFSDVEVLLADAARADVLFIGEQHDNLATHRLELALLEGLARRRGDLVVALEMFERDVQPTLTRFLQAGLDEEAFLAAARPWPQYVRDYKPLVDFAILKHWPVVAGNVPRGLAAEVAKTGLEALTSQPDAGKAWFAREIRCSTKDRAFSRFRQAMGGGTHAAPGTSGGPDAQTIERYYAAQCLKDETMAESIADAFDARAAGGNHPLIVSVNGSFHSDFRGGLVEGTRRRLPGRRLVVVSMLPVEDWDHLAPDRAERARADYLVYTTPNPK